MRISATWLESFRLFQSEDYVEEGELIAMIRGKSVPNEKMLVGTAFHKWIYTPTTQEVDGYEFETSLKLPNIPGSQEVKTVLKLSSNHQLVCKADSLHGYDVHEVKSTSSPFSSDKYAKSYQWRLYAMAFQAARVIYHVFNLDFGTDKYFITAYNDLQIPVYPDMVKDCHDLIEDFIHFCERKGLC